MSGILFISKKCNHCVELVNMINKTELNFEIKIIDIKNMQDMPDFLDRVPLLLIESENKILHDEELFNFMKNRIMAHTELEYIIHNNKSLVKNVSQ